MLVEYVLTVVVVVVAMVVVVSWVASKFIQVVPIGGFVVVVV